MTSKTEKVYQHFVPKFYLRLFSTNRNSIGTYVFGGDKYVKNAPLDSVGGEKYLYGEDGQIEDWFSEFEGIWDNVLKKIIQTNSLKIDKEDYVSLLFFIFLSDARSKNIADINNKFINELAILTNNVDPKNKKIKFSNKIVEYKVPNYYPIASAEDVVPIMLDLKLVLLINNTSSQFITSDSFVCKYNQFLLDKKHIVGYGYGATGFQCFVPISPVHCLMLYDPSIYELKKNDNVFVINDSKEIYKLNKLFYYNSDKYLFFNNNYDKNRLDVLLKDNDRLKEDNNTVLKSDDNHYLLRLPNRCIKKNFNINFIKTKKQANRIKIEINKSAPIRPIVERLNDDEYETPEHILKEIEWKKFYVQKKE